jgi:hypothetical protein
MATQKVRPDQDRDERQEVQRRQVSRTIKAGALAIAAIVGAIVALIAVLAGGPEVQNGSLAATATAVESGTTGVAEGPNRFRPDGAEPAAPEHGRHGKLILSKSETGDAMITDSASAVYVFADGRVIWQRMSVAEGGTGGWLVRRLTPRGIYLLQPDTTADMREDTNPELVDPFGLPAGAWKDPTPEPYLASRYAVCPDVFFVPTDWQELPSRARDLLRGSEEGYIDSCVVVTTADARRLDNILSSTEGFERNASLEYRIKTESGIASVGVYPVLPNATFDRVCNNFWTDC